MKEKKLSQLVPFVVEECSADDVRLMLADFSGFERELGPDNEWAINGNELSDFICGLIDQNGLVASSDKDEGYSNNSEGDTKMK